MLLQLLEILRSGGAHTPKEIARELDTSQALVQSMIDELVRLGFLKLAVQACPGSCESCPTVSCCTVGAKGRLWTLTEAGRRVSQSQER